MSSLDYLRGLQDGLCIGFVAGFKAGHKSGYISGYLDRDEGRPPLLEYSPTINLLKKERDPLLLSCGCYGVCRCYKPDLPEPKLLGQLACGCLYTCKCTSSYATIDPDLLLLPKKKRTCTCGMLPAFCTCY
jgi:hypothetical protein